MKILHWNIHGWADSDGADNVDRVTDFIRQQDPDVVSLVEVDEEWGKPSKLEQVAGALGYNRAFVPAFEYREQGGFGNAILSKSAFRSVHQRQLLPPSLYDGSEPTEPRAVLLVEVVDSPVTFGSTHLPRYDDELRRHAGGRLISMLSAIEQPFVVCGDFNQTAGDWIGESIAAAPTGASPTYPTTQPVEAIDYGLTKEVAMLSANVENNDASDHLPITFEISDTDQL